jgi:spore germination cell wall hydrolase CwlJ-like protein
MAARWVGLSRPNNKKTAARAAVAKRDIIRDCLHALGASSILVMAAAMNFALYPDALAAVVGGEPSIVGFVPTESAAGAVPTNQAAAPVVDENEVRLLAATAWGEARSEGEGGMRAVAHVMVNRVGPRFGEDLATVILSPKQFSVWNRGDPNRRLVASLVGNPERFHVGGAEWETALRVAREVLGGQSVDPTGGALFYHTRAISPRWARQGEGRQVIGAHVFYADVPDGGQRRTPRMINIAQVFNASTPARRGETRRGPRAGRVNGVVQHAPVEAARQLLPSETATAVSMSVNDAAIPTLNGVPITQASATVGATAASE